MRGDELLLVFIVLGIPSIMIVVLLLLQHVIKPKHQWGEPRHEGLFDGYYFVSCDCVRCGCTKLVQIPQKLSGFQPILKALIGPNPCRPRSRISSHQKEESEWVTTPDSGSPRPY
jgi:hypothetical protein